MTVFSNPVGPRSIRVFCGSRLPALTRENFFQELGSTFMPGTPCMLAPLGLAAYVSAVLDLDVAAGLPDEVALIVYASQEAYTAARNNSLLGRMYTHSHAGVFNMATSRGQWPGTVDLPDKQSGSERWAWFLFDRPIDWQEGLTRVVALEASSPTSPIQEATLSASKAASKSLLAAGVEQAIFVAAPGFAVFWLHGSGVMDLDVSAVGLVPSGVSVVRSLEATPVLMPTLTEGPTITGPAAYSFRFVREQRFFL